MTARTTWLWLLVLSATLAVVAGPSRALAGPHSRGGPPRSNGPSIPAGQVPEELDGIGIADKPGADLPRDVTLTGSDGRELVLGEYLDDERPLVLVLAYYGCPMLCSLVLNGTMDTLKAMPETAGKDFRVLVVSFDPRDKVTVARDKRAAYVEAYGRAVDEAAFEFAVGPDDQVARLAEAVGFRYRWSEAEQQYAHAAGIFVVTPKGKLSQVLTGIKFEPRELSEAVEGARRGTWSSPVRSVLLYCFQFNPRTGKYVLAAGRAMQVGAGLTVAALALVLLKLVRGRGTSEPPEGGAGAPPTGPVPEKS